MWYDCLGGHECVPVECPVQTDSLSRAYSAWARRWAHSMLIAGLVVKTEIVERMFGSAKGGGTHHGS